MVPASRDGVAERVQVDDHHVDRLDPVLGELGEVIGLVAAGEEAGEDRGMEGLDPPAEDLVGLGEVGDGADAGDAGVGQVGSRAVGGEAFDAGLGEASRELDDPFAVRYGEEGAQSTTSVWGVAWAWWSVAAWGGRL